jgi:ubiquitin-like 1-activating enzyme E1 B
MSLKRPAPDWTDGIIDLEPSPKRTKADNARRPGNVIASPSKRRRLDEDGLILMERQDDKLEDEVIVVD